MLFWKVGSGKNIRPEPLVVFPGLVTRGMPGLRSSTTQHAAEGAPRRQPNPTPIAFTPPETDLLDCKQGH